VAKNKSGNPKSMRNACIRVFAQNMVTANEFKGKEIPENELVTNNPIEKAVLTSDNPFDISEDEINGFENKNTNVTANTEAEKIPVNYSYEEIQDILKTRSKSVTGMRYYLIKHGDNEDPDEPGEHFHIVMTFKNPMPWNTLKRMFPYGQIEPVQHSVKAAVQYLIHMNDSTKKRYQESEVITNDPDINKFWVTSSYQDEVTLKNLEEKIISGQVTRMNYLNVLPLIFLSKHQIRVERMLTAMESRRRSLTVDRCIEFIVITGKTGVGKTTYAKDIARKLFPDCEPCISSGSRDPLQDYKSEPVLILDDFRDSVLPFHDLLKLGDNNTKSSTNSRYYNKFFDGDLIILTSSQRLHDMYLGVGREDRNQLYRRVGQYAVMQADQIHIYEWDEVSKKHVWRYDNQNYITQAFRDLKARKFSLSKITEDLTGQKSALVKPDNYIIEPANVPESWNKITCDAVPDNSIPANSTNGKRRRKA